MLHGELFLFMTLQLSLHKTVPEIATLCIFLKLEQNYCLPLHINQPVCLWTLTFLSAVGFRGTEITLCSWTVLQAAEHLCKDTQAGLAAAFIVVPFFAHTRTSGTSKAPWHWQYLCFNSYEENCNPLQKPSLFGLFLCFLHCCKIFMGLLMEEMMDRTKGWENSRLDRSTKTTLVTGFTCIITYKKS